VDRDASDIVAQMREVDPYQPQRRTTHERSRAGDCAFLRHRFIGRRQAFWIRHSGLEWETMLRRYYHADGVQRTWWSARKNAYSPEFQKFLSETKSPPELSSLSELFD
jgi:hypothetical protein